MSKNFRNTLATASISLSLFVAAPTNVCSMACCLDKGVEMHRHFAVAVMRDGNPTDHLINLAASTSRNSLKLTWREAGGGSCGSLSRGFTER
jgi:hypothetical protein